VTFSGGKNDRAPITERVSAFNITFERTAGSHSLVAAAQRALRRTPGGTMESEGKIKKPVAPAD